MSFQIHIAIPHHKIRKRGFSLHQLSKQKGSQRKNRTIKNELRGGDEMNLKLGLTVSNLSVGVDSASNSVADLEDKIRAKMLEDAELQSKLNPDILGSVINDRSLYIRVEEAKVVPGAESSVSSISSAASATKNAVSSAASATKNAVSSAASATKNAASSAAKKIYTLHVTPKELGLLKTLKGINLPGKFANIFVPTKDGLDINRQELQQVSTNVSQSQTGGTDDLIESIAVAIVAANSESAASEVPSDTLDKTVDNMIMAIAFATAKYMQENQSTANPVGPIDPSKISEVENTSTNTITLVIDEKDVVLKLDVEHEPNQSGGGTTVKEIITSSQGCTPTESVQVKSTYFSGLTAKKLNEVQPGEYIQLASIACLNKDSNFKDFIGKLSTLQKAPSFAFLDRT